MDNQTKVINSLNKFAKADRPSSIFSTDIQSVLKDTELDPYDFAEVLQDLESQNLIQLGYGNSKLIQISLNRNFPK